LRNTALKSTIVSKKSPNVPPRKPRGRPFKAEKNKISNPCIPSGRPRGRPKKHIKDKANEEKMKRGKNLMAKINAKLSLTSTSKKSLENKITTRREKVISKEQKLKSCQVVLKKLNMPIPIPKYFRMRKMSIRSNKASFVEKA
jgi:hypothetical protein